MNEEEKALVLACKSKVNALNIVLARIEDHGGITDRERLQLSWLFRTGAAEVMTFEPIPGGSL